MQYTTNYQLKKPEPHEYFDQEGNDNYNYDKIDTQIKKNENDIASNKDEVTPKSYSPTLVNGWQSLDTENEIEIIKEGKRVSLFGLIKSGSVGSNFVALPQEYIPSKPQRFTLFASDQSKNGIAVAVVDTLGGIRIEYSSLTPFSYISVSGISYYTGV